MSSTDSSAGAARSSATRCCALIRAGRIEGVKGFVQQERGRIAHGSARASVRALALAKPREDLRLHGRR